MYINNITYRPTELEHISCYDMVSNYELKRMSKKKLNSKNHTVEGNTLFNLVVEHASHKCMVLAKRKNIFIPCINSLNFLPNVADLIIDSIITEL